MKKLNEILSIFLPAILTIGGLFALYLGDYNNASWNFIMLLAVAVIMMKDDTISLLKSLIEVQDELIDSYEKYQKN